VIAGSGVPRAGPSPFLSLGLGPFWSKPQRRDSAAAIASEKTIGSCGLNELDLRRRARAWPRDAAATPPILEAIISAVRTRIAGQGWAAVDAHHMRDHRCRYSAEITCNPGPPNYLAELKRFGLPTTETEM
jgi:hypothetical protein